MNMKKIAILGAGISGLATAWYLHKRFGDKIQLTIIEKSYRVGGWIQTIHKEGFLFEIGPHGFRPHPDTLALIQELDLTKELIATSKEASKRYLYVDGKLQPLGPWFCLRLGLLSVLFREHKIPSTTEEDESIESFFLRRTNKKITESLIDPLVTGIFGGDYRKLSIRSNFPTLFAWEQKSGSLTRGFFRREKKKREKHSLYSFREGMETLPRALAQKLPPEIKLSTPYDEKIEADHIISCIPPKDIPKVTLTTVNLGYRCPVLPKKGYGYLIPSKEKEEILGMLWDSEIFPEQNKPHETRLCVILREASDPLKAALNALEKHLGITKEPDAHHITVARECIPQLTVGHYKRKYEGVCTIGINNCIAHAKEVASQL